MRLFSLCFVIIVTRKLIKRVHVEFVLYVIIALIVFLMICKYKDDKVSKYKSSDYYRQTKNNYNTVMSDAGLLGEYQLSCKLQRYAQDGAKFLYNTYLPYKDGTTEIDIIMIHPSGLYVFENKNYRGVISGSDKDKMWLQHIHHQLYKFQNPIKQNNMHISAIRHIVGQTTNIHSVVVFGDKCKLKIKYPGNNEPVIHIKKLNKRIKKIINYGYISMSKTRVNELYKTLKPYTQVSYFDKQKHIRQCMMRERSTL